MGQHDKYGKKLLSIVASEALCVDGDAVSIEYGAGSGARIDGVIDRKIAMEVEARVSKQIRGAVLDLICHSCRKKLLVIMPVHAENPNVTAVQCRNILSRFLPDQDFRVIVLQGTGDVERVNEDLHILSAALRELGFENAT